MKKHSKVQYLLDNTDIHYLARLASMIVYIESLMEIPEVIGVEVVDENEIIIGLSNETALPKPPSLINDLLIREVNGPIESNYQWLYRHAAFKFLDLANDVLKTYTLITDRNGIEFYLAIFDNGKGVLLEGGKLRIAIPFIRTYYAAHTHPREGLIPSPKDIRALIDLFTYGGLASVIVTSLNSLCIYRNGPFRIEDYEALINVNRYENPLTINKLYSLLSNSNIKLIVK